MKVQDGKSVQDIVDDVVKEFGRLDYAVNAARSSRNGTRDIGRGVIINLASVNSSAGLPGKGSYTISKHTFIGITKMAPEGIRVNAVYRTWVRTPLLDVELKSPEVRGMTSAIVPIKRAAECKEVSDIIAFLCSLAASYINGASLLIDAAVSTTVRLFDY
ncbi:hypothetical protein F5Y10DRAFT_261737 [Nemania abortiva]|nr:hypothetical protein F5Y10DRAFT_261737 [Nemania abortiva]